MAKSEMANSARCLRGLLPLLVYLLAACASGPHSMPRNVDTDIPDSMAAQSASPLADQTEQPDAPSIVYKRAVNLAVDMPLDQVFQIEVRRANGDHERYRFPNSAVPRIDTDAYLKFRGQWIQLASGDAIIYEGPALK